MVGQPPTTVKPSRSDEIIDLDQQLQISQQVRSHFDSILPKRPPKPSRSDPDCIQPQILSPEPAPTIPELIKLQSLISQSQGIGNNNNNNATVEEDFVETGYYKELSSIDKEHHTTGNGFIKVAREERGEDGLRFQIGSYGGYRDQGFRSNPARNDWIPSSGDYFDQDKGVSLKPNRSENW